MSFTNVSTPGLQRSEGVTIPLDVQILYLQLLGAFAEFRKATISFVMSVHLLAKNNSTPNGRMLIKFGN